MQPTKAAINNKYTILFKCYNDKKIATEQLNQQNILFYISIMALADQKQMQKETGTSMVHKIKTEKLGWHNTTNG